MKLAMSLLLSIIVCKVRSVHLQFFAIYQILCRKVKQNKKNDNIKFKSGNDFTLTSIFVAELEFRLKFEEFKINLNLYYCFPCARFTRIIPVYLTSFTVFRLYPILSM